ncbi:bacteriocin immunity protein [Streptomyces krungchingensis]
MEHLWGGFVGDAGKRGGSGRAELVEIVRRILSADPECAHYLRLITANVAHPGVSDLIFHPSDDLQGASAEEIVDEALRYRPIAL